ncbi:chemotaxis protein CheD [Alteromonas pelagimontana]|uniref:Probable chemoreceptor glutamine deamidase CheD n=1 Tax=Alteromonas pelagimontana TaxID=1858656 RepID=A0A6M4MC11_9ALTE|nr:chemotaxis protein CheD [Alteromonas pelagimontana]QJR80734.1 chemotaxis protein CheD [Alteromonas pelagimontana]
MRKSDDLRKRYPRCPLILHAGEVIFGYGQRLLSTLLGSCVAITLWHPKARIGGMCHFALPSRPQGLDAPECLSAGRYGDECIALFKELALKHNTRISDYQAKIFGGGNMLTSVAEPHQDFARVQRQSIGDANSHLAYSLLSQHKVKILEADVGEAGYRQLWFDPNTGESWVKFVAVSPSGFS